MAVIVIWHIKFHISILVEDNVANLTSGLFGGKANNGDKSTVYAGFKVEWLHATNNEQVL